MKIEFIPRTIWGDNQTLVGFSDLAMENPVARDRIVEAIKQACWKRARQTKYSYEEGAELEFHLDLMGFRYEIAGRWYASLVVETVEKIAKIDEVDEFCDDWPRTVIVEDYREQRKRKDDNYAAW